MNANETVTYWTETRSDDFVVWARGPVGGRLPGAEYPKQRLNDYLRDAEGYTLSFRTKAEADAVADDLNAKTSS